MEITKKVQFLVGQTTNNNLFRYDFLDLESNLPFSVYSVNEVQAYKKLVQYSPSDVKFNLVLSNVTDSKGNSKIVWKVKAVN